MKPLRVFCYALVFDKISSSNHVVRNCTERPVFFKKQQKCVSSVADKHTENTIFVSYAVSKVLISNISYKICQFVHNNGRMQLPVVTKRGKHPSDSAN